jgi:hypothetical protein
MVRCPTQFRLTKCGASSTDIMRLSASCLCENAFLTEMQSHCHTYSRLLITPTQTSTMTIARRRWVAPDGLSCLIAEAARLRPRVEMIDAHISTHTVQTTRVAR